MATRINLNIEADTPSELRDAVTDLAGIFGGEGDAEVGADAPGLPTTGRGRRKKTSPAATAALEATAQSGAPAATPGTPPGSEAGLTATPAASPSEPGPSTTTAVTKEMVAAAMSKAMEATSPLTAQKALGDAGLPLRMSELTAEQYPAALTTLNNLVASVA